MTTKPIKQSETRSIKRSQINFNPVNPKRHAEEKVKLQRKKLQKVGFLGGVVWNERTGNLVDGHRRIKAMDLHYHYDGTSETDYDIKVEVANFDDKTEKEQLAYMAVGNTKPDIDLLASFVPDIDYSGIGLEADELNEILAFGKGDSDTVPDFDGDFFPTVESERDMGLPYEDKKEHMKDVKREVRESAQQKARDEEAYIMLSFSSFESKADLCDLLGISTDSKFAKGEDVLKIIS